MNIGETARGFAIGTFHDLYLAECSLQQSSLATQDAIWLGAAPVRMHLSQSMVALLLPHLQAFVETGEIDVSTSETAAGIDGAEAPAISDLFGAPCTVDRDRGVPGFPFAVVSPFKGGSPGTAVLGAFAYRPHAVVAAIAAELLAIVEKVADRNPLYSKPHERPLIEQARAAVDKIRGAA